MGHSNMRHAVSPMICKCEASCAPCATCVPRGPPTNSAGTKGDSRILRATERVAGPAFPLQRRALSPAPGAARWFGTPPRVVVVFRHSHAEVPLAPRFDALRAPHLSPSPRARSKSTVRGASAFPIARQVSWELGPPREGCALSPYREPNLRPGCDFVALRRSRVGGECDTEIARCAPRNRRLEGRRHDSGAATVRRVTRRYDAPYHDMQPWRKKN